jgi:Zn-dependent peptidase ImmA (M78 family)/transcriptional regulator with XRE-family HTH domain
VPERLTEAREARGLTITALAESTGIAKQSLSAYENHRKPMGPKVLSRLAEALEVPAQFLMKPTPLRDQRPIFFRSLAAATKRSRASASTRLYWLCDVVDYFAEHIEFLPIDLPDFDVGPDPSGISMEEIESAAEECRSAWGLGRGPVSHIVRLLENRGVIIVRHGLGPSKLDAFSKWSGNGVPVIVLGADKESAVRSRLDAAHELGHLLLHKSLSKLGTFFKPTEQQAFRFASAFLLPSDSFTREVGRYPNLDTFCFLKPKWKVSIKAMIMRCRELELITPDKARYLWMSYMIKGWRTREPLDDKLEIERPVFLQRCADVLFNDGGLSPEQVLSDLALSAADLEAITGIPASYFIEKPPKDPAPRLKRRALSGGPRVVPFRKEKE